MKIVDAAEELINNRISVDTMLRTFCQIDKLASFALDESQMKEYDQKISFNPNIVISHMEVQYVKSKSINKKDWLNFTPLHTEEIETKGIIILF